ncbi:MAG TPA: tetratricopeptide repeat protein [Candidatus Rifleibacterium sp.]|nr:tetratricopeptide repeat protein [Candidatus Rifleibacterium sp.]HPT44407.1 tetratricopeptide repeat protein [Candidatus Rifleibacterium sp.]
MNRFKNLSVCLAVVLVLFLQGTLSAQSEKARELNRQGQLAIDNGHHQEAIQLLKQAMQLEPGWGEPYFNAAKLLRLRNKRDEMAKMLKKAITCDPENKTYAEAFSKLLKEDLQAAEKAKNSGEADRLRSEILRINPGEIEIGVATVNQLLNANEIDKALSTAENLIDKNAAMRTRYDSEAMGQLFFIMARIEMQKNNLTAARSHAENATKFSLAEPDSIKALMAQIKEKQSQAVTVLLNQAADEKKAGNAEAALQTLKRAEEILPTNDAVKQAIDDITQSRDAKSAFAEASELVKKGSWLEARDLLEYVVSVDGGNSEAQNMLKQATEKEEALMKKLGRPGRLPRTSSDRSALVEGFLRRGVQFIEAGNQKDAAVSLNRGLAVIELDTSLERFKIAFTTELAKIQNTDDQRTTWEKALEARNAYEYEECLKLLNKLPKDYDLQLPSYLAEAYLKTGDNEQAKSLARYQLANQPENNRAKFILGTIFLEEGDKDLAYKYFKEIYDSDPDYPEINDKLISASTSKWKTVFPVLIVVLLLWIAWALYKYLPEYNKNSAIRKAQSFLKKEMHDECIEELTRIRRLPNLTQFDGALISRILAQAYLKRGIYDRAIGECKHLISISPKDEDAHTWLGYAYLGRRMLSPESMPELLNLYNKDQRNIALVSLLGSHYTQQKNLSEDGIKVLEQWLNLDPNNPEVLKPLGRYYLKKNRSDDKAMKVFQKMMELGSPEAEFLLGVARIHLKLRQFDSCLQLCEQVINADINNELVHAVLREAYQKQNRIPELLEIYGNFLKNNPYNVAFQNGLREAQKLPVSSQGPAQNVSEPVLQQSAQPAAADEIACLHCGQINSSKEYCCQHCGQNLV